MSIGLKPPGILHPVEGVRLAATSAGIYAKQRPDLCLIEIAQGATAAGVFTQNAFCAAPVVLARKHLATHAPRYCLINAGNANAGTGDAGMRAALRTCETAAGLFGCRTGEILPFSTGVIGQLFPTESVCRALPGLAAGLTRDGWLDCAMAIMTTDTVAKAVSVRVEEGPVAFTVTGMAKGAGMIHPDMATMLAFIFTDADIAPSLMGEILRQATTISFNRISVDGDTSTNDSLILVATGRSAMPRIDSMDSPGAERLRQTITDVCIALAQAIVRDGEGATKFITINVCGGLAEDECLRVARAIATSPLVKTAFFASDPNWGRILAAIGRAGVPGLELNGVSLALDRVSVVSAGQRDPSYTEEQGQRVMRQGEVTIHVGLGRGTAATTVWTCDFSHEYVRINAEYRS